MYKKDYPYTLDAENASSEDFPFLRTEGCFKVVLGWFLQGSPTNQFQTVQRALVMARNAETPGKQANTKAPEGIFTSLGGHSGYRSRIFGF